MANNTELNTGPFIWGAAQNAAGQPDDTIARTGPDISRETFMDDTFRAFMLLYRSGVWHKGMNADLLDGQHADEFQPICATLTALCALSSYGLVAKTAANTIAARTITASATAGREGIAITNGDGVSGNPEVGLNIGGLTADTTLNSTDEFPYRDATAEGNNKIDASNLAAQLAVLGGYATTATAVTAAAVLTDGKLVMSDGGARGAKVSGVTAGGASLNDLSNIGTIGSGAITSSGFIKSTSSSAGIGYATGAGGTVTQLTSKTTAVTLDKICGDITMHNAALAAGATAKFTVNNSVLDGTEYVMAQHTSGGASGAYVVEAYNSSAGGLFQINVTNITTGSLSEAIVIRFIALKGATA